MPREPLAAVQFLIVPANPIQEVHVPFRGKGAVMLDLNGRIAFASTYFCDLVGVEHDKVARMSYLDFVFPEDMHVAKKIFEHNHSPRPAPSRLRLRRTDGSPVWADVQRIPLQTARGEVYAISATITAAESLQTETERHGL
jgi:PAS domain S-box-containing protein